MLEYNLELLGLTRLLAGGSRLFSGIFGHTCCDEVTRKEHVFNTIVCLQYYRVCPTPECHCPSVMTSILGDISMSGMVLPGRFQFDWKGPCPTSPFGDRVPPLSQSASIIQCDDIPYWL